MDGKGIRCLQIVSQHVLIYIQQFPSYSNRKCKKSPFSRTAGHIFHTPLHSTPPLGGFPSEYHHPFWYGKTRMVWLPDGEKNSKISLFVFAHLTNVMDRRTPHHGIYRAYAYASCGKKLTKKVLSIHTRSQPGYYVYRQ